MKTRAILEVENTMLHHNTCTQTNLQQHNNNIPQELSGYQK